MRAATEPAAPARAATLIVTSACTTVALAVTTRLTDHRIAAHDSGRETGSIGCTAVIQALALATLMVDRSGASKTR
jgi:hypothetical protein